MQLKFRRKFGNLPFTPGNQSVNSFGRKRHNWLRGIRRHLLPVQFYCSLVVMVVLKQIVWKSWFKSKGILPSEKHRKLAGKGKLWTLLQIRSLTHSAQPSSPPPQPPRKPANLVLSFLFAKNPQSGSSVHRLNKNTPKLSWNFWPISIFREFAAKDPFGAACQ